MDISFLTLFASINPRKDILNAIIHDMATKQPEVFKGFVDFCSNNLSSWQYLCSSAKVPPNTSVPVISHYTLPPGFDIEQSPLKRILVTSTQAPGYGGSATNAYKLCGHLRKFGVSTSALFFQNTDFTSIENYDPERIGGVWRIPRFTKYKNSRDRSTRSQCKRDIRRLKNTVEKYLGGPPQVIICKNYIAPIQTRVLYPDTPIVYLVSGSIHATQLKTTGTNIITNMDAEKLEHMYPLEIEANQKSNLIIPNSSISAAVFNHIYRRRFFPKISPPINTSEIVLTKTRDLPHEDWENRKYDVAFIVSNVKREVKGPGIARSILNKMSPKFVKIVVGENSEEWEIPNTETITVQPHKNIINILHNTKVVIVPSFFDASPNLLAEALECGAYPITTLNVGNSEYLHDSLRVTELENISEWVEKIETLLGGLFPPTVFEDRIKQNKPKSAMALRLLSRASELITKGSRT